MVRSTTHRSTPSPLPCSTPRSAIRGVMPRLSNWRRCGSESYPRSAIRKSGLRRGRPGFPRTGGMASTRGMSCVTSFAFAPVSITANGIPFPSVIR